MQKCNRYSDYRIMYIPWDLEYFHVTLGLSQVITFLLLHQSSTFVEYNQFRIISLEY